MVPTNMTPAAASVIQGGKAQIAQCPPALTTAMTTADVWMGNVCAIKATQEMTVASCHVQTTAMTKDTVWMESACASHTSLVKTAASRSALMTALVTASVWMATASVTKAFMGRTVHQVIALTSWDFFFIVLINSYSIYVSLKAQSHQKVVNHPPSS